MIRSIVLSVFLVFCSVFSFGQKTDSLLQALNTAGDRDKATLYRQLADLTLRSDPAQSMTYAQKSVEYASRTGYKWCQAYALRIIGILYDEQGNYNKAVANMEEALKINREINSKDGISACLSSFGVIYMNQSKFDKALEMFLEVLPYYDDEGTAYNKSLIISNIAAIYKYNQDHASSVNYYRQALQIMRKAKSTRGLAISLNNLGMAFYAAEQRDSAMYYLNEGLAMKRTLNDKKSLLYSLSNLTEVYTGYNETDKALATLEECMAIEKEINDPKSLAGSYMFRGDLYAKMDGGFEKAVSSYVESFELAKKIGDLHTAQVSAYKAGNLYYKLNDFQKAADYVYAYTIYKDSIYSNEKARAFAEMQTRFDTERKEKEILLLSHQNKIKELELTKANTEKQKRDQEILLLAQAKEVKEALLEKEKAHNLAQKRENDVLVKDKEIQAAKLANARTEKEKLDLENHKRAQQLMYLSIGAVLLLFLLGFAVRSYRQKKKANDLLGKQNKEITEQKEEIQVKNHIITEKQKEIVDSINYAQRIQYALLANREFMNRTLGDYFVLFKPKDIVSGDFYWACEAGGHLFLAVCDSTGHGVPGAFMSLLNISFMNEAINEKHIHHPGQVFDYVRKKLVENVSQDGARDGMDGILIQVDKNNKQIRYVAANNAPLLMTGSEMQELKCDKMPVGKGDVMNAFEMHTLNYKTGDTLYLYTDGYADQFGGEKGKKFKNSNLKKLLTDLSGEPLNKQESLLADTFENWRGDLEQIDDVCVMGIRF